MKKHLLIWLAAFCGIVANAQFHFSFTHYTSDNGLSQNSITAMLKDRKGYLWLGTRDGLNRFDGYNFTIYNSAPDSRTALLSNRIIHLKEDNRGFIWAKTYDEIVFRVNPANGEMNRIPDPDGGMINEKINEVYTPASGTVWLSTYQNGCYRILTAADATMSVTHFSVRNRLLPDNNVNYIYEDQDKNTWVLTNKGLKCLSPSGTAIVYYDDQPFYSVSETAKWLLFGSHNSVYVLDKRTRTFKKTDLSSNSTVVHLGAFPNNNFLLGTSENGFYVFDLPRETLEHFTKEKYPQMKTNEIMMVYVDKSAEAWLGIRSSGILHYVPQKNKVEFVASNINEGQVINPNNQIFEDDKDLLWVQPYYGSFSWYDRASGKLIPFHSAYNEDINTLLMYGVNHVLSDSQGVMWISTNRGNGFFKCTFLPDYFNQYLFDERSVYSISNEIRSIFEDREKRLWVACKDGAIHVFDENRKLLGRLDNDGRIRPGGNLEALVYNIFQDKAGNIWMASKRKGLFLLKPVEKNRFRIENFQHNPANPYSPSSNDFYSVTQDRQGRIWAGSYGGGLNLIDFQGKTLRFIHSGNLLKNYPIANCSKVREVYVGSDNKIWVGTTEGFVVFDAGFSSPSKIRFDYYHKIELDPNSLGANDVHCFYEDATGQMWLGTFGGGLNRLKYPLVPGKPAQFEHFDRSKGMPNNVIYAIIDDHLGDLWLTTENSIVRFNLKTHFIESFGKGNELENVEFSEATACLLQSGEICVGSKSGFYSFVPEAVKRKAMNAPLVFTGLLLFNKRVEVGAKGSILQTQIDDAKQLVFHSGQNVFTIEFATLDMRAPERIHYAYQLEGFDADWNYVRSKHFATYTSLPPGTYYFRVKSTDSEGIWLDNTRTIEVKILPSFWQSGFARFLYVLVILLIFGVALYISITIFKLKNNVIIEQNMSEMKLRFFTDISHELRTPLTLISLPVENILHENLDPGIREQLLLVRRNIERVMTLINQILDFRKLQNNKMRLTVEEVSFGDFVRAGCSNFNEIANSKDIRFNVMDETHGLKIWVDPDRLDSVIYNLLSNAFKFTPSGKRITVKTTYEEDKAVLYVIDEGVGIAQEKINNIFDRFFSSSDMLRNIMQKSTGIGLDLVKKLVELHHGQISVESQVGKGTTFKVEFLTGVAHFDENVDIIVDDQASASSSGSTQTYIEPDVEGEPESGEKLKPHIVLVEDNEELRHFLKSSLKSKYRVDEAENGETGWKKIQRIIPDFIITDLRMPLMDGMELVRRIKEDPRTSHIPVILLTAVTDMESRVAGLRSGADDYITKPFSSEFLHARIENLIHQRHQLQSLYRSQYITPKPDLSLPPIDLKSPEEIFMQNLLKLMNENIDNFDLNIDYLASELGMSRTVFFNKLKSLTGLSPVEFVREVRFERAAEYMRSTQLTVSEISYQVGIEDPRYFSRCFKQKFGVTPSEYRAQQTDQGEKQTITD